MLPVRSLRVLARGLILVSFLSGCSLFGSSVGKTTLPSELDSFYRDSGWVPLPIPDSKFRPGALIEVTSSNEVRYWDDLSTCNVPIEYLKPVEGSSPALTMRQDATYKAEALLQIYGVTAGPEFGKVAGTTLSHNEHGGDALKMLAIQIWLMDPANTDKFPQACKDFFNNANHFLVQEAYRVSKGKYTLLDRNKAKIKLSNLPLGPVTLKPGADVSLSGDGELLFNKPVYTAVRRVRRLSGNFETLGTPTTTQASDDAELDRLLHK